MNSLSSKPFAKKTFYIDLKGFPGEKNLIKDLELLGGKQEVFLSKTVSFVVSNRISFSEGGSPSTPLSSIKSVSPYLFKDGSLDSKNSPASNSPILDARHHNEPHVPLSRGMSVLQKAREKCQGNNKFVMDICKQWNIKVYPVQKVLTWIEKYKAKYFKHGNVKSKQELRSENHVTKLYSPFIKIEDTQRKYKPRYKVFSSWVESVDSTLLQITNRLALNFKQFGNIDCSARLPLKEIFRQPTSRNGSLRGNSSRAASYNTSKVASNSVWALAQSEKQTDKGSRSLKAKKEKPTKKRKVYCEICRVHYNDGESHYEKNPHARFLNNPENYKIVREQLDALPTLEDFLNSIQAENSSSDKVCEEGNLDERPLDKCLKDSCMTEEYTLNENDYISASCSSGGTPLPFLEKEEPAVGNISCVENVNPPLLLPECYNVPLNLVNDSIHAVAAQNGVENRGHGLELNSKLMNSEYVVDMHGNYLELSRKENCFEYNLLTPASLAPHFTSNFNGNEIDLSCLEQTSSVVPLSVINWNGKIADQPLDLSNYSMNNAKIVSLCNNGMDFNTNDNFACVTGNASLNSPKINVTVNQESDDGGFDSDPNLAGFDVVINNCLEEVSKSLDNDTSTAEEDGPTNELKFPDPKVVECSNLMLTCADPVPQDESFKEHSVENLAVNVRPNDPLREYPNAEWDAAVSVNKAHPDFSQSGVETIALLPLEPSVTSKEEREDPVWCNNRDENMACDPDVSEKSLSSENSERLSGSELADFVKCVQAKVSPELLNSDDTYLVLDEADNSFKSVKDLYQLSEETSTLESLSKVATVPNEDDTKLVDVEQALNKAVEHNVCDSAESPVMDTVTEGNEFSETESSHNNSLRIRERVSHNAAAHFFTDRVGNIRDPENKVAPCVEEETIKEIIGISEQSSGCLKIISQKETGISVSEVMELSYGTMGQTGNPQSNEKSTRINKVCESEAKHEIDCNKIEDSPHEISRNENISFSADNAEYCCEEALTDCKESKCAVKRASESEETSCKRMKISLNDYKMVEGPLNASNNECPIFNVTLRDEGNENIAQYPSVCEPSLLNVPISLNCDGSCPNENFNSSYSSSWESSPSSSSEGNRSLLAGLLPCMSADDTDAGKAAHIVYLSTPLLPTTNPLKQGSI